MLASILKYDINFNHIAKDRHKL